jgi:hypothetical protein
LPGCCPRARAAGHRPRRSRGWACRSAAAELERDREVLFDAVEADPSRATLLAAVEAGRSAAVTSVIGFGGGSPMDVAKLAAYLLGSGDDLDTIWGVGKATGSACRWRWCRPPPAPARKRRRSRSSPSKAAREARGQQPAADPDWRCSTPR